MRFKEIIAQIMPSFMRAEIVLRKDLKQLHTIQRLECRIDNLRHKDTLSLDGIFDSHEVEGMWSDSEKEISQFIIPDGSGGVNPGDRRAIYYLISVLQPLSILEIGTHIGASTLYIASALYKSQIRKGKKAKLTTVDTVDVNSATEKPWLKYGTTHSPLEMVNKLNYGYFVEFVTDTSLQYAASCEQKFDFIFLDGDHSAKTVYQEIPVALSLLNQNGVILLHDYFLNMYPLWSNGSVIPGPFLATERLREEGSNFMILPLGELPWPTKLQSNITSLALLLNNS